MVRSEPMAPAGLVEEALAARLRFMELACKVSAGFIDLPSADIDRGIDAAIHVLGTGLELDLTYVGVFSEDRTRVRITYQWVGDGIRPAYEEFRNFPVAEMPWFAEALLSDRAVVVDSVQALPPEAAAEQRQLVALGVQSLVLLPLSVARHVIGLVGFDQIKRERAWTEETRVSLQLVAEIIASALDRKRADGVLRERLGFEELVTTFSTRLVEAETDEVDAVVQQMLEAVAERLGFGYASLLLLDDQGQRLNVSHQWSAPGTAPLVAPQGFLVPELGWPFDRVLAGEAVLGHHGDIPRGAAVAAQLVGDGGLDTHGFVPITIAGKVRGCVTFRCASNGGPLPVPFVARLRLVGEMLASTLARRRAELERRGAFDELARLKARVEQERDYLREEVRGNRRFERIIGTSPAVRGVLETIEAVAATAATVLFCGESGVGKELFVQALHAQSRRADGPLVRVNCAAIPKELFESEFFGHVKGAFSGALKDRVGRFELASGGTLFLDEVGEIPLDLQSKLLRVLQEGEFERVGDDRTRRVDARVVAATNRSLEQEVAKGRFRQDLYYRLSVFPIFIPPLRERPSDIVPIAEHYLGIYSQGTGRTDLSLTEAQQEDLLAYDWPGNIRELQNVIERGVILSGHGPLRLDLALPETPARPASTPVVATSLDATRLLRGDEFKNLEKDNLLRALEKAGFRVSGSGGAAELLGLRPSTLRDRMKALGIAKPPGA